MQLNWPQILRFLTIILLQGLILQRVNTGGAGFNYISIMLYPVLIMLLPMKTSRYALLFIAFALGFVVDLFYVSPGVHMSACVFIAFLRPFVLLMLEPRGGYPVNANPTSHDFGMAWFLRYAGILLFAFLLVYFAAEVFTIQGIGEIMIKTFSSFIVSFLVILLYVIIFNPKH